MATLADRMSPLMKACYGCMYSYEIVRRLLEEGADPNNGGESTPLENACYENNVECAQLLLEFGADPNLNSPLVTACECGHEKCVKLLLDSGADIRYGQVGELITAVVQYFGLPSFTLRPNHKKILDLLFIQREEMEERLYDNIYLPRDMIKEIHSFL